MKKIRLPKTMETATETEIATATKALERGVEVIVRADEEYGAVEAVAVAAAEESIPVLVEKTGVEVGVEVEKKDDNFNNKKSYQFIITFFFPICYNYFNL